MVTIYCVNLSKLKSEKSLKKLLRELPSSMHERARRYRSEQDAYAFVWGRLLLEKGLKELGLENELEQIGIDENGKPFVENCFFNISHTNDLVVCAISKNIKIGIDIEYMNKVDLSLFEDWFTKREWETIHQANQPLKKFYDFWTRKESVIKALGLTLSDLNQLPIEIYQDQFSIDNQTWYLQKLKFGENYKGCLCCNSKTNFKLIELQS